MKNTCSIKLLKKAFIGEGVRMTGGKGTVPFENLPMIGMEITGYSQLGFQINHKSFPRGIWVKFDQLPLTRLTIKNGIIEDEIAFVENIVSHSMQLIRTEDTEYIDLLFAERNLAKKVDDMIPVGEAIVGTWYKGAQCKAGIEMVFLGAFYQKSVTQHESKPYPNYEYTYHLDKNSPKREFFAVKEGKKWDIVSYPSTNKKIKKLIQLYKDEPQFADKTINKEIILVNHNDFSTWKDWQGKEHALKEVRVGLKYAYPRPLLSEKFKLKEGHGGEANYIQETKENIDVNAYNFINKNFRCEINPRYGGGTRYNSRPSIDAIDFGDERITPRELLREEMINSLPGLKTKHSDKKENTSYYVIDNLKDMCRLGYSVSTYDLRHKIDENKITYEEIIDKFITLVK
jgi:hypothetical protein